jgi:outer membrane receptor protein involved in Fe transport
VANFAYYDFVRNAQILGNPNLKPADIVNLDLKWEWYTSKSESVFLSLFGKKFFRPIEQIVADGSVPSNLLLTYKNPNSATLYGIEIELKKNINDWLNFYSNTALMKSQVEVAGVSRSLQGQSNYVINGGFNMQKGSSTFNLSYNRIGERISAVGFQGYPDIMENSRDLIDITYLKKIGKAELKLSVNDLLAQPSIYYQQLKIRRKLIETNNEQTISITLNYKL